MLEFHDLGTKLFEGINQHLAGLYRGLHKNTQRLALLGFTNHLIGGTYELA
ncbi:MAG: hypothetical protein ACNA7W_00655 [Pseudomonadales bacterium]